MDIKLYVTDTTTESPFFVHVIQTKDSTFKGIESIFFLRAQNFTYQLNNVIQRNILEKEESLNSNSSKNFE